MTDQPPQPAPITCPICHETHAFEWDGEDWLPDCEWWYTDTVPFLDSRHCWLKAEGYRYDREVGDWIKTTEDVTL